MTRLLFLVLFLAPSLAYAAEPIKIGSQRQLFLDDYILERTADLKRTLHQPEKRGRS